MREARQHKEIQSRVIQSAKQASQGVAIVDNRDNSQTRLMDAIQQKPNNTGLPDNLK